MAYRYLLPAIGAVSLALTAAASAADMPSFPMRGAQVTEYFSSWYIRVDGGYRFNEITKGNLLGSNFSTSELKDSGTIGGGVGYKYAWFRSDITVDYGTRPEFIGNTAAQTVNSRLNNYTVLWNGYIDLGSWYGFTPYVGGGLGYSFLKPADFNLSGLLFPTLATDSKWTPSWAAMAGISYLFSPVWLVDVSYRYLNLGDSTSNLQNGTGLIKYGQWTAQEIRLGLRYLIP
jgi:opacity protein-like surface antigen